MSQVCPLRTDHDSFNYSCSFSAQMCNNVSECILDVFLAGPQLADVYTNLSNRTESAQLWLEVAVLVNLAEQQSLNGTSTVPLLTSDRTRGAQTTKHTVFTSTEGNKLTNQQIVILLAIVRPYISVLRPFLFHRAIQFVVLSIYTMSPKSYKTAQFVLFQWFFFAQNVLFKLCREQICEILKFQTRFHFHSLHLHRKDG